VQSTSYCWHNLLIKTSSVATRFGRHGMPPPASKLIFDRLTLKLVCESHLRWGTFLSNLGMLGLCILELFTMYTIDRQTDGWTDKSNAYCLLHTIGTRWHKNVKFAVLTTALHVVSTCVRRVYLICHHCVSFTTSVIAHAACLLYVLVETNV